MKSRKTNNRLFAFFVFIYVWWQSSRNIFPRLRVYVGLGNSYSVYTYTYNHIYPMCLTLIYHRCAAAAAAAIAIASANRKIKIKIRQITIEYICIAWYHEQSVICYKLVLFDLPASIPPRTKLSLYACGLAIRMQCLYALWVVFGMSVTGWGISWVLITFNVVLKRI